MVVQQWLARKSPATILVPAAAARSTSTAATARASKTTWAWGQVAAAAVPLGTVALYGPDDKTITKIAAGVILHDGAEAIMQRWVATDVTTNPKVQQEMKDFFLQHGVKQVAMSQGNMGCPHEEGEDFRHGEDCPFCPFWKGKQGSNRRVSAAVRQ
jgi:hypothetical protein